MRGLHDAGKVEEAFEPAAEFLDLVAAAIEHPPKGLDGLGLAVEKVLEETRIVQQAQIASFDSDHDIRLTGR